MKDNCIFIIDEGIINEFSLIGSTDSKEYYRGESAQLFFEYLSYRCENKKAFMIPSIYKRILKKLEINDGESLAYFKNWVEEGDIGQSPNTTEEEDTISLFKTLEVLYEKVFIVSEKYDNNKNFKDKPVLNFEKISKYLKDKKDFMDYINRAYYSGEY
jgi:hypothetical protein